MTEMTTQLKSEIRVQDIVAKTARVNLRDTVRVLRALSMVFGVLGDKGAKTRLDSWLNQSAQFGGFISPLHSKPDAVSIDACDDVFDILMEEYSDQDLEDLYHLQTDPYYDQVLAQGKTTE